MNQPSLCNGMPNVHRRSSSWLWKQRNPTWSRSQPRWFFWRPNIYCPSPPATRRPRRAARRRGPTSPRTPRNSQLQPALPHALLSTGRARRTAWRAATGTSVRPAWHREATSRHDAAVRSDGTLLTNTTPHRPKGFGWNRSRPIRVRPATDASGVLKFFKKFSRRVAINPILPVGGDWIL